MLPANEASEGGEGDELLEIRQSMQRFDELLNSFDDSKSQLIAELLKGYEDDESSYTRGKRICSYTQGALILLWSILIYNL